MKVVIDTDKLNEVIGDILSSFVKDVKKREECINSIQVKDYIRDLVNADRTLEEEFYRAVGERLTTVGEEAGVDVINTLKKDEKIAVCTNLINELKEEGFWSPDSDGEWEYHSNDELKAAERLGKSRFY